MCGDWLRSKQAKARDEAKRAGRRIASNQAAVSTAGVAAAAAAAAAGSGAKPLARGLSADEAVGQRGAGSNGIASGGKPGASVDDDAGAAPAASKPSARVRGRGSVQAPGVERGEARGSQAANGDGSRRTAKQEKVEEEPFVLDKLFRKTSITPSLYWLPLSEEEVSKGDGEKSTRWGPSGCQERWWMMVKAEGRSVAREGGRGGVHTCSAMIAHFNSCCTLHLEVLLGCLLHEPPYRFQVVWYG